MSEAINILIYVLDDNNNELELIRRKFDQEHIVNYKMFTSYDDFLNEFNSGVHLAVIDYMLGGAKTGLEILSEIKQINPFCLNIVLTGYGDWKVVREFFLKGASDFIAKEGDYLQMIADSVKSFLPNIQQRIEIIEKWFKDESDNG